jgi:8-oxo-dGTP pyrophosphatase MutT (NUDIX family)
MEGLRAKIEANLAAFERVAIEAAPGQRRAAVAILISPLDGVATYAITRRAMTLRRGAGNFALPGGHCDGEEEAIEAALRETAEELGVELPREAALGLLDDFITLAGHRVTPVVLWSDAPFELKPNPEEVHLVWLEPLSDLDHPEAPMRVPHPDGGEDILRMFVRGHWINPPTAAFLYQFREVALHGRPTRVSAIGQPSWTAR